MKEIPQIAHQELPACTKCGNPADTFEGTAKAITDNRRLEPICADCLLIEIFGPIEGAPECDPE